MQTVIIQLGQSLTDLLLQETGSLERVMEIASLNDVGITEELEPGAELLMPESTNPTSTFIKKKGLVIATA